MSWKLGGVYEDCDIFLKLLTVTEDGWRRKRIRCGEEDCSLIHYARALDWANELVCSSSAMRSYYCAAMRCHSSLCRTPEHSYKLTRIGYQTAQVSAIPGFRPTRALSCYHGTGL